jgi:hypothetical protein
MVVGREDRVSEVLSFYSSFLEYYGLVNTMVEAFYGLLSLVVSYLRLFSMDEI